ncbi:MAG: cysteine-rich KTR domain-containing protein [Roseburia inulinivorans]
MNPSRFIWYPCPKCGSHLLAINKDTEVKNLPCKCKHCKRESLITIEPISQVLN